MAKKRINKEDIAPKDIFANITEGAAKAKTQIELLKTAVGALKSTAETIKQSIPKGSPTNTKGMAEFDQLAKKANATAQAKLNIDKKILLETERLKVAKSKQNKLIKETIALEKAEIGSLKRLRLESKKLRDEKERLNLTTKKGAKRLKEINTQLDKNNAVLKKNATQLGKQKQNIGNYGSAVTKLRGGLAQLGLAFGVFSILRGVFTTVRDFGQAQADLASVLGINVNGMKALTEQAKELGSTTTFTASQVSELQKELAKLGFTQDQIQNMTAATLELAEASGTDLAEAATVVGANLRAFSLTSGDAQKVVDVMAKSFSSSSLDMTKFSTSMATVAPVANAMGFSIERTTALIATMTNNGVEASTAGTGLRNMMLLSQKAGLTLDEALEKINGSSNKVATSFELFGQRGATLGVILAENRDTTADLTTQLLYAEGSAKKMAETQRDTLGGSVKLLTSAWEGLVLKLEEGTGVFGGLKTVIAFVADNLETIVKVLAVVGTAFGVYKLIEKTTKAFKAMSLAMNANPFGLIIAAIAAAAVAFKAFTTQMTAAEQAAQTLKDVELEAEKAIVSQKDELQKLVDVAIDKTKSDEERQAAIEEMNRISPEFLGNLTLANIATEEGAGYVNNYTAALERQAMQTAIASKMKELQIELLEAEASTIADNISWYDQLWAATKRAAGFGTVVEEVAEVAEGAVENREERIAGINAEIEALLARADALDKEDEELGGLDPDGDGDGDGDGSGRVRKMKDLARQIRDEEIKQIKDKEDREKATLATSARRRIKDLDKDRVTAEQKKELTENIEENLRLGIEKIGAKYDKIRTDREAKEAALAKKAKEKQDKEIADAQKAEIEQLTEMYDRSLKKKEKLLLQSTKTQEEVASELLQFEIDQLIAKIKLYKVMYPELTDVITGFEIELAKKLREQDEAEIDAVGKTAEEIAQIRQDAIEVTTNFLIDNIDKRIAKIEEESTAAKKQADLYRQLAANGNITAKESLAEQNKIIAEAEAEKERLEKRKQQYLLVSSILLAYNTNLENNDDSNTALAKAITSKAVLDQFIAGIGTFFDGTEDTGTVSNALDSNGGRMAILHNNERVMTAKQNSKIGNVTNEEVARVMENHRIGNLVDGNQVGSSWNNQSIVNELMSVGNKLDKMNSTISNKETNKIELGEITQSTMKIMETRQKGLKRTISTYKIR